jgi:integrase
LRLDARRWAQSTEAAIRERRYFKTKEAQRRTLGELVDRYIRDVIPKKAPWARAQVEQLAYWRAELGGRTLADVTPAVIAEARDKLARGVTVRGRQRGPGTTNRYLSALSHAFVVAVREWQWLEDNPLRKVTKPKEPRGRVRYLGDDERGRLLEACQKSNSPDLYCATVLALSTGARRMEILGLRWGQVDFARRAITVLETKNGEIRSLPLVGHAFALMVERAKVRRIDTDLVFPGRKRNRPVDLRSPFGTAVKRAGYRGFPLA